MLSVANLGGTDIYPFHDALAKREEAALSGCKEGDETREREGEGEGGRERESGDQAGLVSH